MTETRCERPSVSSLIGAASSGSAAITNVCAAPPLPGWSNRCAPPDITRCAATDNTYFKVTGVDHFLSKYTAGSATTESGCGAQCTSDCNCLGYFYNQEKSKSWIAYELKTLTEVSNSAPVEYIKTPNK